VLELAASAQRLRGLVHVSSAFVNMNMPRGSIIDEAVYPLRLGRQVVDVEQVAKVGQRGVACTRVGGGGGGCSSYAIVSSCSSGCNPDRVLGRQIVIAGLGPRQGVVWCRASVLLAACCYPALTVLRPFIPQQRSIVLSSSDCGAQRVALVAILASTEPCRARSTMQAACCARAANRHKCASL
jgi:hypothetical protein